MYMDSYFTQTVILFAVYFQIVHLELEFAYIP